MEKARGPKHGRRKVQLRSRNMPLKLTVPPPKTVMARLALQTQQVNLGASLARQVSCPRLEYISISQCL